MSGEEAGGRFFRRVRPSVVSGGRVEDEMSLRDRIAARLDETHNLILATQFRDELIMQLVERHEPVANDYLDVFSLVCTACSDPEEGRWTMYPCAELQMIARMLGVDPTG